MTETTLLSRLRTFMLWLVCALCVGIVIELWLTDHMQEPLQLVPFALCALGLLLSLAVLFRPTRATVWALRAVMLAAVIGGLVGVYAHLAGNLTFAQEVNAARASRAPIVAAVSGGNPPLAPGALGVTAAIGLAATYWHPAVKGRE